MHEETSDQGSKREAVPVVRWGQGIPSALAKKERFKHCSLVVIPAGSSTTRSPIQLGFAMSSFPAEMGPQLTMGSVIRLVAYDELASGAARHWGRLQRGLPLDKTLLHHHPSRGVEECLINCHKPGRATSYLG